MLPACVWQNPLFQLRFIALTPAAEAAQAGMTGDGAPEGSWMEGAEQLDTAPQVNNPPPQEARSLGDVLKWVRNMS